MTISRKVSTGIALCGFLLGTLSGSSCTASPESSLNVSDPGIGLAQGSKPEVVKLYRVHAARRQAIAALLLSCWKEEKRLNELREDRGRSGDMARVIPLERDLLKLRRNIDRLRQELHLENRVLMSIDYEYGD